MYVSWRLDWATKECCLSAFIWSEKWRKNCFWVRQITSCTRIAMRTYKSYCHIVQHSENQCQVSGKGEERTCEIVICWRYSKYKVSLFCQTESYLSHRKPIFSDSGSVLFIFKQILNTTNKYLLPEMKYEISNERISRNLIHFQNLFCCRFTSQRIQIET